MLSKTHESPYVRKTPRLKIESNTYNLKHLLLRSANVDDDYPDCTLSFAGFGKCITLRLPHIIKSKATKVYPKKHWDEEIVKRLGRDYYTRYDQRSYGITLCAGHVTIYYGLDTMDSDTSQHIGFFLPWTQYKFLRRTIFDGTGVLYANFAAIPRSDPNVEYEASQSVPKVQFTFLDFDGETITASCFIEEREWSRGESWCSWLKYFYKNKVVRSMDIEFSAEVGKRKKQWKGGVLSMGFDMLQDETVQVAWNRFTMSDRFPK